MALISSQRVEYITGKLLEHLCEYKEYFTPIITTQEFLSNTNKGLKARKTLGEIFRILKLNPQWVIENELNDYLKMRNLLVHEFWIKNLINSSEETINKAFLFCHEFGSQSQKIESFFKGFMYFLALRHVSNSDELDPTLKKIEIDFQYFMTTIKQKSLLSADN